VLPAGSGRAVLAALAVVLAALGVLTAGGQPAVAAGEPGRVLVVGVAGLRWDDVDRDRTPALWQLLSDGSSGVAAVRNVRRAACPTDGWLALSAGARAADEPPPDPAQPAAPAGDEPAVVTVEPDPAEVAAAGIPQCRLLGEPVPAQTLADEPDGPAAVPRWSTFVEQAEAGSFDARPGLLGDTLAAAGAPATAVGPGAAIALAGRSGVVAGTYVPRPAAAGDLRDAVASALADSSVVVVDAGAVRDPTDLEPGDPEAASAPRRDQVGVLHERIEAALDAAAATGNGPGGPPGRGVTVLVASLADSGTTPQLQLLAAAGPTGASAAPAYETSLLGSRSTRQEGLVQVTDLLPTVLRAADVAAPGGLPGAPVDPVRPGGSAADRLRTLLDLNEAALAVQPLVPPFFNGLVVGQILLYGGAALALRNRWGGRDGRRHVLSSLRRVAVVFATVPISTFLANLVPWWRSGNDLLTVVGVVLVWVAVISAVALLGPWRDHRLGPFGLVAGVTSAVLAVDVATGSNLQISSLMGQQPVVAGRFYGLGNVQFALFGTGALLLATALADRALTAGRRRLALTAVVVTGLVATVVDGTPGLGSDFGGPPALIPAFALLALLVAGVRVTWQRLLLIGVVTVAVVAALCVVDWLRPPEDRTHLGRFVQTLLDGGAGAVVLRKLEQNWAILRTSFLTVLVPFAAVFIGLVLMRPVAWGAPALQRTYEAAPTLRHGLTALLVMLGIGFAVNDSGTVVPAIGSVLCIPLLIAASVRTLELADGTAPASGSDRTATPAPGP
jgi:hypothetical protein